MTKPAGVPVRANQLRKELPVASTPANNAVRRGQFERQSVYLRKWFRLMPRTRQPASRIGGMTTDSDEE